VVEPLKYANLALDLLKANDFLIAASHDATLPGELRAEISFPGLHQSRAKSRRARQPWWPFGESLATPQFKFKSEPEQQAAHGAAIVWFPFVSEILRKSAVHPIPQDTGRVSI